MKQQNCNGHAAHYTMPAEWHTHAATWGAFPFNEDNWPGYLNEARKEYADFVLTVAQFEPVHLFVNDDAEDIHAAQSYFKGHLNITLHVIPLDDVWYRDNGPTFVKDHNGHVIPVKWRFNAWGNKFPSQKDDRVAFKTFEILNCDHLNANIILEGGAIDVNGNGVLLTTRQCLLNPNRNENFTQADLESYLKKYLGTTKVIWLNNGLKDDHTDGHVDTIARFVNKNEIVCVFSEDENDENFAVMKENLEILKKETQFKITLLPLPKNKMYLGEKRLACTYANFYMSSQFVIVPMYDDPNDDRALEILRNVFPNHTVVGCMSKYIIRSGGSFHCLTQQQPAGALVSRGTLLERTSDAVSSRVSEMSSRGVTAGAIRLGLVQMSMTSHLNENLEKAFHFVREAAKNGAQVILIPELFENLYFCQEKNAEHFKLAHEFKNHPFISKFQQLAKELNVVLPISFFEKSGQKYYNSIAMINNDGTCLGVYRKTNIPDGPCYEEKFYFQPGDTGFKVWNTGYGRIGVGICWDQWFPECARAMTLLGADLLLYPTAIGSEPPHIGIDTKPMWQNVMIGHAIANSVYVAAANRVGQENQIHFYGSSFVSNFKGEKIAELDTHSENVLYADCNFENAQKFRQWLGCVSNRGVEC